MRDPLFFLVLALSAGCGLFAVLFALDPILPRRRTALFAWLTCGVVGLGVLSHEQSRVANALKNVQDPDRRARFQAIGQEEAWQRARPTGIALVAGAVLIAIGELRRRRNAAREAQLSDAGLGRVTFEFHERFRDGTGFNLILAVGAWVLGAALMREVGPGVGWVVIAAGAALAGWTLLFRAGVDVRLHEQGVWWRQGEEAVVRWEELSELSHLELKIRSQGVTLPFIKQQVIILGTELGKFYRLASKQAAAAALGRALTEKLGPLVIARAKRELAEGGELDFGPLQATAGHGLRKGDKMLPLSELRAVNVDGHWTTVFGVKGSFCTVFTGALRNVTVLQALTTQAAEKADPRAA